MAFAKKAVIIVLVGCCALVIFYGISARKALQFNQIAFLDIGQGDATLIRFDDDALMLVDCGAGTSVLSALSRHLPFWERSLDYLVITHTDRDHFGGCVDVLRQYKIINVITNGRAANDPWWLALEEAIQKEGVASLVIDRQQQWQFASSSIFFLYPDHAVAREDIKKDNNASVVAKIIGQKESVLMMADAETELEQYLVDHVPSSTLRSSILKVGHHGSKTSSSELFLNAVMPHAAIISSGKNNRFGHPHLRVLMRLQRMGIEVRRTDQEGDIIIDF